MSEYKYKQFHARMKHNTYLRLKKEFPSEKNESASKYFERLAEFLKEKTK